RSIARVVGHAWRFEQQRFSSNSLASGANSVAGHAELIKGMLPSGPPTGAKRMVATLYVYAAMFLQTTGSTWDLRTMWGQMSLLPRLVVITLFVLSVYSFGVMIDRALMYSAARKQSRIFVEQVAGALKDGKLDEAIAIAERNKKSHIAKVVATGLSEFQSASQ